MTTYKCSSWCWKVGLAGSLAIGGVIVSSFDCAKAQITPDSTLGAESSVVTPNVVINGLPSDRIDVGAQRGANLFHSFTEFNIDQGRGAYFTNPAGIENILSRVTGNDPSDILGTLGVLGNANLFLMNPNGIIFGPNASLDVEGSFVATTANAIQFADRGFFSTSVPNVPSVLTVNPSSFLFNQIAAQSITNQSLVGLQVPDGESLLLLSGDVSLDGGILQALGGRVELGGVAEAGTVGLRVDGNNLRLSFLDDLTRANISLTNGAGVNVTAGDNGSIAINARNLEVLEGSFLFAGIGSGLGSANSQAGDITLNATEAITIADESLIFNRILSEGKGNGGSIDISAGSLSVTSGARLGTSTFGPGNAGSVNINARDAVSFAGVGSNGLSSAALSIVQKDAAGQGGSLNITAGSLFVTDGAQLLASTFGPGNAGSVNISARDTVSFAGVGSNGLSSAALSIAEVEATGHAGSLNITADSLFVTDGAQLVTSTFSKFGGDAGSININARDTVSFDGESAAISRVEEGAVGQGGNIEITAGSLSVTNGSQLIATTGGRGNAGSININARDTVFFTRVSSNGFSPAAFTRVEEGAVGQGGSLNITAGSLFVTDGAQLLASTFEEGDAGDVNINARDAVSFAGVGSNGLSSGLFTSTESTAKGEGGEITVNTATLRVQDGAVVSARTLNSDDGGSITINANTFEATNGGQVITTTRSSGKAGNITLNITGNVTLSGSDPTFAGRLAQFGRGNLANESPASGLFANTAEGSTGQGGDLRISTEQLTVQDGAEVTVSSQGAGDAGNLEVAARSISLDNEGKLVAESASGQGGNITLQNEDLLLLRRNSAISATAGTAGGGGDGGNITIDTDLLVALEDSNITANAFEGRGGKVQINTQGDFRSLDSDITASSQLGPQFEGVVEINTPDVDVQRSLTQLSANFVSPEQVVAGSCLARRNVEQGSFTVTGTGGLPRSPYEAISGRYPVTGVQPIQGGSTVSSRAAAVETAPWRRGDPIQEAQGMAVTVDGRTLVATTPQLVALAKAQNLVCHSD